MWERGARTRGAIIATAVLLLAGCSAGSTSSEAPAGSPTGSAGPWSYTDDLGETVTLDSTPERIVAYEESAAYLMSLGVRPVGVFGSAPMDQNPYFEDLDMTGIESLGEVYGEVNAEKTAAVQPDIIVSTFYAQPPVWGFTDDRTMKTFGEIAPIVALDRNGSPSSILEAYQALAGSMGVDVETPELTASRDRYAASLEGIGAAAAGNEGIDVLAISASQNGMYVAGTTTHPDLFDYSDVGVRFAGPEKGTKENFEVWETLSWENADKYPADIVIFDARPGNWQLEDLMASPSFASLPAAKAGQVYPWHVGSNYSWDKYAEHTDELAADIAAANDVA